MAKISEKTLSEYFIMALKEGNWKHINVATWFKLKPYLQDCAGRNVNWYDLYIAQKTNPSINS